MPQQHLRRSLSLPMLVALGTAGILGSSWVYTASAFFADYGAGGEIFGLALAGLLLTGAGCRSTKPEKPYVVEEQGRSTWRVLFDKKMPSPTLQWEYAQKTREKGHLKQAERRRVIR